MKKILILAVIIMLALIACQGEKGADGQQGVSMMWQGELTSHPTNPQVNWAYYNTDDKVVYIYTIAGVWAIMVSDGVQGQDGIDGKDGVDGIDGQDGLSIMWQGESAEPPLSPQINWAYYNTIDNVIYIYTSEGWSVMLRDITSTYHVVNIDNIQIVAPITGETPVMSITKTEQYTGTVVWLPVTGTFAASTAYTAIIFLTAKKGYTLQGVSENFFYLTGVIGATVNNAANSGIVTVVFPKTYFVANNITQLTDYLASSNANTADSPIHVKVNVNLDTDWNNLLSVLNTANKYVALDLSGSTGMVEFAPGTANTGERLIVKLVLPNSSTSIVGIEYDLGKRLFMFFTKLKKITGLNITNIGENAFMFCTSLTTVSFPVVTSIGEGDFDGCISLTTVSFPAVTSIGDYAFNGCISLTTVSFPVMTSIGRYAFYGCTSLISVSFPAVTSIGEHAFDGCRSLTSISFPVVTSIDNSAFWGCTGLTTVSFPAATSIGDQAFSDCISLTAVSFPAVTSIGAYAFYDCISLTSASFPVVTSIGDSAFEYCMSLTSVTLGTIILANFSDLAFDDNLRDVYFAAGGGAGTYIRTLPSVNWVKQP